MNYPKNIEQKLGIDQVKQLIADFCLSPLGSRKANALSFSDDYALVNRWQQESLEFIRLMQSGLPFPSDHYIDVTGYFKYLDIEGFFLDEEQLHRIRLSLNTIQQVKQFFKRNEEQYPILHQIFREVNISEDLVKQIDRVIDKEGKIKPSASRYLLDIESLRIELERDLQKKIAILYRRASEKGYVAETEVSVRDNRFVLPVLAEHKRHVPGFVHDESGTGQVYYIEPSETLELNNRLRELILERKREIERILKEITRFFIPYTDELILAYDKLGEIDFIRAKAIFSRKTNATVPVIKEKPAVKWKNAVHPLLFLSHKAQDKEVIPLNIELNDEKRVVVISGPNAGGKSVALKTVGMLQYLLQCGIPVPADERSEAGIFKQVFIDIGDEQSIENDLSTYSSHLRNLKHFAIGADKNTLVLIDELGTGTDPHFGGPMAESFLESLHRNRPFAVITTHFSNLKILANNTRGMSNASMAFDVEKMQPLFRLEMGIPGSSYAFEVAEKIGLPREIIQRARQKVGNKQKNVDELIVQLEKEQNEVKEKKNSLEEKEKYYNRLLDNYTQLKLEIDNKKAEIIRNAKKQAADIIEASNKLIEKTIREIKENKADSEKTRVLRDEVEKQKNVLKSDAEEVQVLKDTNFAEGDHVRIKGQFVSGRIISSDKKNAIVAYGDMRTKVPLEKLEKISVKEAKKIKETLKGYDMNEKMSEFSSEIDLRGKRGDEALKEMIAFLDQAIILGFEKLRLLHGKGDGILRKLLREELKKIKAVKGFEDEHVDFGGQGVTVVHLR